MRKKGFTLIELIVVMAIISILVLLGVSKYKEYTNQARITKLIVESKELEQASQKYYIRNQDWPRLSDVPYNKDEVESFADKIYDKTGAIVELEESGSYYDVDYTKLGNYISKPINSENYILQNPVGNVYSLYGLTNKRLPQEIVEDIEQGNIKQIIAGFEFTTVLLTDGTVKTWGNNQYGQLGIGNTERQLSPVIIPNLSGVQKIAVGRYHSIALLNDGTLMSWGRNYNGQLGIGNTVDQLSPALVLNISGVKDIVAGGNHTIAIMGDGSLMSWGSNNYGQLGIGNTIQKNSPVILPNINNAKKVVASGGYTIFLLEDGSLKSCGWNKFGQLGRTTGTGTDNPYPTPTAISSLINVKDISVGQNYAIALMEDGSLMSWGVNIYGQLGRTTNNGTMNANPTPTVISGLTDVKEIVAGDNHTIALMKDGTLKGWGHNYYYQLGVSTNGQLTNPSPIIIDSFIDVKQVIVGGNHTLVLLDNGKLTAWGNNQYGQLGQGTSSFSMSPKEINLN